jgi:hypothetical protein
MKLWKKYPDEIPEEYETGKSNEVLLLHKNKGIMHDQLQWSGDDKCYHLREYEFYPIREKGKIVGYVKDSFTHWCYEADLIASIEQQGE